MRLIADEQILFRSPDPKSIYCFTPAVLSGDGDRLIVGVDLGGPGTPALEGPRSRLGDTPEGNQVRLLLSDDGGTSWREAADRLPMRHEVLFRAGKSLYAMGNAPELVISRSDDNGDHWTTPTVLAGIGQRTWHQSSTTPVYRNGNVYLVMERPRDGVSDWPGYEQVLLAGREDADLCDRANWRFSPAFDADPLCESVRDLSDLAANAHVGLLETQLVPLTPECGHLYSPDETAFLLCARFNSPGVQIGAILKGVDHPDGRLEITRFAGRDPEHPLFAMPFPGASLKIHVLYDEVSRLYFLAANQPTCVFAPPGVEAKNRRTLLLWAARDAMSWQPLGTIARGPADHAARNYPHMAICGDDLLVAVRSGDEHAASAHNNNLITLHRVRDFRRLAVETGL